VAAKDGELGVVLLAGHGVVAPFARRHHPPIDPQHLVQFAAVEEDRPRLRLRIRTVDVEAHGFNLGRLRRNASLAD